MSLLFDETQEAIAQEASKIIETFHGNSDRLAHIETIGAYDKKLHELAIAQGWFGVSIPESYGGLGLDLATAGLIASKYGAIAHGVPFLTSSFGFAQALLLSNSEDVKANYLPPISDGQKIGCFGFAEGQDTLPQNSIIEIKSGKINGTKPAIIGALKADYAIILGRENGAPVLALVDLGQATIKRRPIGTYDNSRLLADLVFENSNCQTLAIGAAAIDIANQTLARLGVLYAFEQLGAAEDLMKTARNYAIEREAFGQKIGAFQSVKHRITELYALVELARANAIDATARSGSDFILAAAAARLSASEAYDTAARDCMQIHGAIGVTWELGLHLHLRRARSLANEIGNNFYWEDVLVQELLSANMKGAAA